MAIGERIRFFRNKRGMTQKSLGMMLGFPEKSSDVRMAQYETGARTPKSELTVSIAGILDVSEHALLIPDIDSLIGLIHTMFALEDRYGLTISEKDGDVCLRIDVSKGRNAEDFHRMLCIWCQASAMQSSGEISREEYDRWRYHYPEYSSPDTISEDS